MVTYPDAAKLARHFDPARLNADLDVLRHERWGAQRAYGQDGSHAETDIDWRILPLRSVGGDPTRTDPGGAGLEDFADTPWLAKAPYLSEVIAAVPAPVRSVRLMKLGASVTVPEHCDGKYGFACGTLRLHIPIQTNPESVVVIEGRRRHWEAGQLWFGDFGRRHYVVNMGSQARVHMVIDCLISRELIKLFPASFLRLLSLSDVMFARDPLPLIAAESSQFCCRFSMPEEFPQWSEEEITLAPDVVGSIESCEGRLVLAVDGDPAFGLIHLGLGEFRLVGWTEERTIIVSPDLVVRFRMRNGRLLREHIRQARPL